MDWIIPYSSMGFFVHFFHPIRCYIVLYVLGELFFVSIFIFLHQVTHIICNVLAHDMLAVNLCIEFFAF